MIQIRLGAGCCNGSSIWTAAEKLSLNVQRWDLRDWSDTSELCSTSKHQTWLITWLLSFGLTWSVTPGAKMSSFLHVFRRQGHMMTTTLWTLWLFCTKLIDAFHPVHHSFREIFWWSSRAGEETMISCCSSHTLVLITSARLLLLWYHLNAWWVGRGEWGELSSGFYTGIYSEKCTLTLKHGMINCKWWRAMSSALNR